MIRPSKEVLRVCDEIEAQSDAVAEKVWAAEQIVALRRLVKQALAGLPGEGTIERSIWYSEARRLTGRSVTDG
jgi:hypothetical protein